MPKRARKKQYRPPSIIDSDMDRQFSPSESESSESDSSIPSQSAPVIVPSKRPKQTTTRAVSPTVAPEVPIMKIDYVVVIFSAVEMQKACSKRVPKRASFQLQTDEPWDTLKAQLLAKITDTLNPTTIDFSQYDITIAIPRVISKTGIPLTSEAEYKIFLRRITPGKAKIVLANVTITQTSSSNDKENTPENNAGKSKKKLSKDTDLLPGNVQKVANIQALMVRWKCEKRQLNCMGTHCYILEDGAHLALSHEALESWAFAMVSCCHSQLPVTHQSSR